MPVQRHFLGWDRPVVTAVCDHLLTGGSAGTVDLSNLLVVVPTRQAGRLLREALVQECTTRNSALFPPRIVTPAYFLNPESTGARPADPTAELAVWTDILRDLHVRDFPALFPAAPPERGYEWALHNAVMFQRLRNILLEGGLLMADLPPLLGEDHEEAERWRDLARLEGLYLQRLAVLGLEDGCRCKLAVAERPSPPGQQRIVVASVPDPVYLVIRLLDRLARRMPIDILVHAPPAWGDDFDEWGRPLPEQWERAAVDIPEAHRNVLLADNPAGQSRRAISLLAESAGRFGPDDVCIGVADPEVAPFLDADLNNIGLPAYDPAGMRLTRHPLHRLLLILRELVAGRSYSACADLLRHPDFLLSLCTEAGLASADLLSQLDRFQNYYLPGNLEDMETHLPEKATSDCDDLGFPALRPAVSAVRQLLADLAPPDTVGGLRQLLKRIYSRRNFDPADIADRTFLEAAAILGTLLDELSGIAGRLPGLDASDSLALLLQRFGTQTIYPDRERAVIDLEGWLELAWNNAPFLVVTGMNEGKVPDSRLSDPFLPDSLRRRLNLRHDRWVLARDAYLLRSLVESRRRTGRCCFLAGKAATNDEPLKPSRLLFLCSDSELADRTAFLFGRPGQQRKNYPATTGFRLIPPRPDSGRIPRSLPVTALNDYLRCPFRFYLKKILKMSSLDDWKEELDPLDFGSLLHRALETLAREREMCRCTDEHRIAAFLAESLDRGVTARFKNRHHLPVAIQIEAARQRLRTAAGIQAKLASEGWEIIHSEFEGSLTLAGITVTGRIDRVDRHRETGRLRLIDYKTADTPKPPRESSLSKPAAGAPDYALVSDGGKTRQWMDLQLPLYLKMLQAETGAVAAETAYFHLAKAAGKSGLEFWDGFSDELLTAAGQCAEGIINDILGMRFWPPARLNSRDDEFAGILPGTVEELIQPGILGPEEESP